MSLDKLFIFLKNLDQDGQRFLHLALDCFLGEALFPEEFDIENDHVNLEEFQKTFGPEIFSNLYPCALEFFFSNEYFLKGKSWNVMDVFLKETQLSPTERDYYEGLKNSYMGLYEVRSIQLNKSITLKSLIEKDQPEIVVKEKKATHSLTKWDILGARLVKTKDGYRLAGGVLLLSREASDKAKETIETISNIMRKGASLKDTKSSLFDFESLIKKMWAKEIACEWFCEAMNNRKPQEFFNSEGDKLQFCTLEFPLKGSKRAVIEILNSLSELKAYEKDAWFWPVKDSSLGKTKNLKNKGLMIETHLQNIEDGRNYSIYAEVKLKPKKIIVEVNSEKRATIMVNFFTLHLNDLISDPHIKKRDLPKMQKIKPSNQGRGLLAEDPEILANVYDEYYKGWLDSHIPCLDNKTPREAAGTKQGRIKLIALLKDMQNSEERKKKVDKKDYSYDFNWIFKELGIQKEEL